MTTSRRDFLIGGAAAFGAFGAFGGNRFILAPTGVKDGARPRLRFGVVSDTHITKVGADEKMEASQNNLTFKHTLEWFRSQNADAVVISGDLTEHGIDFQMLAVAQAWYAVFPNDKYPDGRKIEKIFVTGNHDWIGHNYGNTGKRLYPDSNERSKHILQNDMPAWWQKIFNEPYEPIYSKNINGFTFIGAHWDMGGFGKEVGKNLYAFSRIQGFLDKAGKTLNPKEPFFYIQHPHLKDTCYGARTWGHDRGDSTKALSAYSNAIALSGHSHFSLTDERSVWQGAFTSVGAGSLRYTGRPSDIGPGARYENSVAEGKNAAVINAMKTIGHINTFDCRQGMLWSVYDDCIVVNRREFLNDVNLGPDWVLPLTTAESKPFAFVERAKKIRPPEFVADGALVVTEEKRKVRGLKKGKAPISSDPRDAYKVLAPVVVPDDYARLHTLEFTAATGEGKKCTKLVLAEGYNHSLKHSKNKQPHYCFFLKEELGAGEITFTVTPMNCYGERGKTLSTRQG